MPAAEQKFLSKLDLIPWIDPTKLGLYIHLPFCQLKCVYCSFVSAPPQSEAEMDRYLEALCKQLRLTAPAASEREVTSIFFGGGTPSLFGAKRLERLLKEIHTSFRIYPQAEITLEANPESASFDLFKRMKAWGVNRVSLGAQSFHDEELRFLGRIHTAAQIPRSLEYARRAGIDNVSLDLIFAFPHQTPRLWEQTLERALACEIDHLSAYSLSIEEGTPLDRMRDKDRIISALDEICETMYTICLAVMADHGLRQYEISNWARPNRRCRHNCLYWDRNEYLAFGVSAHGYYQGFCYGLIRDTSQYAQAMETAPETENPFPPGILEEHTTVSKEEAASDVMIFGLRKTEGIDINVFEKRFGYSPFHRWEQAIRRLIQNGLLEWNGENLRLTQKSLLISNEALMYFLD